MKTDDDMRAVLALVLKHGSIAAAARAEGIARPTLQGRVRIARAALPGVLPEPEMMRGWAEAATEPAEKPRFRVKAGSNWVTPPGPGPAPAPAGRVPLSEDQRKFHAEWTADDCIAELRRIAEIDTTKVITRNYFRNNSDISESTWNRFFGTFLEFKRQAEITLSRHAHGLERQIAKHASVDKTRALQGERSGWEGKYLRPQSRRFQTVVVISDTHGLSCDPFVRSVFMDTVTRMQPSKVVLNGDMLDCPAFSKHTNDPRSFDVVGEIRWLHQFLRDLRTAAPNAEIIYNSGNHEDRLLRHLAEETPAMMVLLSDLHGWTVPKLLGLSEFEINYVARGDLSAWNVRDQQEQLRKNYVTLWDALLFGHFPEMQRMGLPGGHGHHHKHMATTYYSPLYGPYQWLQLGCGHRREANYCAAEKWGQGFAAWHVDTQTKRSQPCYFDLSHDTAMVDGKWHERLATEPVIDLIGRKNTR